MIGARVRIGAAAAVGALILMIGFGAPAGAAALKSKDQIARQIAQAYNVEVIRIREVDAEGRAAYAVTIMNAGGNFNTAFQVNTLLVDAATGDLIPTFRHEASGYRLAGAETNDVQIDGRMIRRRSQGD